MEKHIYKKMVLIGQRVNTIKTFDSSLDKKILLKKEKFKKKILKKVENTFLKALEDFFDVNQYSVYKDRELDTDGYLINFWKPSFLMHNGINLDVLLTEVLKKFNEKNIAYGHARFFNVNLKSYNLNVSFTADTEQLNNFLNQSVSIFQKQQLDQPLWKKILSYFKTKTLYKKTIL